AGAGVEEVRGVARLPALVLRSPHADAPLALRVAKAGGADVTVLAERALVRVAVEEGGQAYHASFLLRQVATPHVDVELPSALVGLGLRISLGGKEAAWHVPGEEGRVARVSVGPDLLRRPVSLDVRYQLPLAGTGARPGPS